MIRGIGVDTVETRRLQAWQNDEGLLRRYFHEDEIAAIRRKGSSMVLSLAARFAAKEAFGKALGTGLAGLELKDIVVMNDEHGKPELTLAGSAQAALDRIGGTRVFLSLTHEQYNAIAMVVIEGETL